MCSASHPSVLPSPACDSQREAFLAQQRVAAVAAAGGPDGVVLRKMTNQTPLGIQVERAMKSLVEVVGGAELLERGGAHPRHDAHAERDVNAIGDFDPDFRQRRAERTHHIGDDVHGAAAHRAVEPSAHLGVGLGGIAPVVGRTGFVFGRRAYKGELFGARDIVGIGTMQIAVGAFLVVERDQDAFADGLLEEALTLGLGTIAPHDAVGLHQLRAFGDPFRPARCFRCERCRSRFCGIL